MPPAPSRPGPPRPGATHTVVIAGAVLLAMLLGALLAPWPASVGPASTGDPDLAARLRAAAGPGHVGLAAAEIRGSRPDAPGAAAQVRTAAVGDDGNGDPIRRETPFEIGSITKTLTGAVLADLVRQGVVRPQERVRDLVLDREWRPGGGGDATLAELASHRSGLPRLPGSMTTLLRSYGTQLFGLSPYDSTAGDVFDSADAASLSGRGEVEYSNLGVSLLGQALAARTGTPYPELLHSHVTGPLGMAATTVPEQDPPVGAARGHDESGRPMQAWISPGDAPAGSGVYSTVDDMARYAEAILDGWAPGADAAAPRWDAGGSLGRIGYGWYTLDRSGHTLLWKNGGSGGMTSSLLLDPGERRAVIVFGNSEESVDDVATALLGVDPIMDEPWWSDLTSFRTLMPILVSVVLPLLAGWALLGTVRGRSGRRVVPVRRSGVLGGAGSALLMFAVTAGMGAVGWVFAPFWLAGCGLAGLAAGLAMLRWREIDPDRGAGGRRRWLGAWLSVIVGLAAAIAVGGAFV